jgi:2-polyprenyl-3-methyl-5-hydroxy-6-metoxy-1,4-benzoquinol methylase
MSIGTRIRGLFGSREAQITALYRSFFIDLDHLVLEIKASCNPTTILEIGCGEGALCEKLSKHFKEAEITGIDITPRVGRLYNGGNNVRFQNISLSEFIAINESTFDLVIACDVLHHLDTKTESIFDFIKMGRSLLSSNGTFVIKEWIKIYNIYHLLCFLSDRILTGDNVVYYSKSELEAMLFQVFDQGEICNQKLIFPRKNNLMYLFQKKSYS